VQAPTPGLQTFLSAAIVGVPLVTVTHEEVAPEGVYPDLGAA